MVITLLLLQLHILLYIFGRAHSSQGVLEPPEDRTITTLWVGGVEPAMSESALRSKFAAHGEVAEVRMIADKVCSFHSLVLRFLVD